MREGCAGLAGEELLRPHKGPQGELNVDLVQDLQGAAEGKQLVVAELEAHVSVDERRKDVHQITRFHLEWI